MEYYGGPLGRFHSGHWHHVDCLPRCKTGDGHLVEIVFGASVGQLTSFVFFQEQCIYAIIDRHLFEFTLAVEPYYANQRVKGFKTVVLVELLHGINDKMFHLR